MLQNSVTTTLLTLFCFDSFTPRLLLLDLAVLSMQSSSLGSWFPVILVTVFNAGDTAGRLVSGYMQSDLLHRYLFVLSLSAEGLIVRLSH